MGASALITAAITAFYDLHRARGPDFFVYPDYFLFHVGRPRGDHAGLDIWPSRKEVVVPEDLQQVLEAINDRAITRQAELGTELEVERPEGTTSAMVVEKPFIDPKKETP